MKTCWFLVVKARGEWWVDCEGKATTMDRKLIAKTQQYEVSYFARKHRISAADARAILQDAGRSRQKANQMAEAGKKRK
jgi:hypothetical protein